MLVAIYKEKNTVFHVKQKAAIVQTLVNIGVKWLLEYELLEKHLNYARKDGNDLIFRNFCEVERINKGTFIININICTPYQIHILYLFNKKRESFDSPG